MSESDQPPTPSLREVDPVLDLLARLRLASTARIEPALIVEGPTERTVLPVVIGCDVRQVFSVEGRPNVLRCARELAGASVPGVVCVADRDFDESEAGWRGVTHLVFYDGADLEAMLFLSPAFERFIQVWASGEKLMTFGGAHEVRAAAIREVMPISALRATNARQGWGLRFADVDLSDVVSKDGELQLSKLVGRLSREAPVSRAQIEAASQGSGGSCPHTDTALFRGKDAMTVVAALLRRKVGNLSAKQVEKRFVERSVGLAAIPRDIEETPFAERFQSALDSVA